MSPMRACLLALFLASLEASRLIRKRSSNFVVGHGDGDVGNISEVIPIADSPKVDEMEPAELDDTTTDVGHPGAAESQIMALSAVETNSRSCSCRFGMYPYQSWPPNQAGGGCVGGCGGGEFQINKYAGTIKKLTVWTTGNVHSSIKGIRFTWHDDAYVQRGRTGGGPWSFTFQPGEYVVGDFRLSGNGRGSRLGSLAFSTSQGRSFDVGMRDPYRYLSPSGGAYIGGFMGRDGYEIDLLGVIFWKPIISIRYESLSYPTLNSLARLTSPDRVASRSYCNSGTMGLPAAIERETKTIVSGYSTCVQTGASVQFGQTITMSGGVPLLGTVEAEAKWEVSASRNVTNCQTQTKTSTKEITFPALTIPPRTSLQYTYSRWSGSLNKLPFQATLRITMSGASLLRSEYGTYTGVSYTDVTEGYDNFKETVLSCNGNPPLVTFFRAQNGDNCKPGEEILNADLCQQAGAAVGFPFNRAVEGPDRPTGCFWDPNGASYYNMLRPSNSEVKWAGGLCFK